MTDRMSQARVEALISAYGADPLRWPEAERAAAQSFIEANGATIQPSLEDAVDLDRMLAMADVPSMSSESLAALSKAARPSLARRICGFFEWQGPVWQPAGALAAALMFGAVLGLADPDTAAAISGLTGLEPAAVVTSDTPFDFDPFGEEGL